MNDLIVQILLCSAWGMILAEEFEPFEAIRSFIIDYTVLSSKTGRWSISGHIVFYLIQAVSCSKCLSYHLFWISYLVIYHSFYGMLIGVASYFLTLVFRKVVPK